MRSFLRLLACMLLFAGTHAFALLPKVQTWSFSGIGGSPAVFYSLADACSATKAEAMSSIPTNLTLVGAARLKSCGTAEALRVDWEMDMKAANGTVTTYGRSVSLTSVASSCPANSAETTGGCNCIGGYSEANGQCKQNLPKCTAGTTISGPGYFDAGTNVAGGPPVSVCKDNCLALFEGDFPSGSSLVANVKHYYAKGKYVAWGSSCTATADAPTGPSAKASVPADTCASNQAMGVVGGRSVCVDKQPGDGSTPGSGTANGPATPAVTTNSETTTTTESSSTSSDGTKTTTQTTTVKGADGKGSVTTSTTTERPDGTKTTTTETHGPAVDDKAETGKCEKNSSEAGCGGDPTAVDGSGLYTAKQATVAGVLSDAKNTLLQSPAGQAVGGFFNVNGGGSCPTVTGQIAYFKRSYTFDGWCSSMALNMLLLMKVAVLLAVSFLAFRIAVE